MYKTVDYSRLRWVYRGPDGLSFKYHMLCGFSPAPQGLGTPTLRIEWGDWTNGYSLWLQRSESPSVKVCEFSSLEGALAAINEAGCEERLTFVNSPMEAGHGS